MEITGESDKQVMAANGGSISATHTALLPTQTLSKGARESYVVPEVQENLMSVPVLSDNGYTTIFLPDDEGVKIYEHDGVTIIENAPPVLQGCRDERGLWFVPIADEHTADVPPINAQETAMNVYNLPSTKEVVRFLHAAPSVSNESNATYRHLKGIPIVVSSAQHCQRHEAFPRV